jgi:tRNA(Ile)-lysidine synthase
MFSRLEREVLATLKNQNFGSNRVLVAYSGGLDSQALLSVMAKLAKAQKLELGLAYIHHGAGSNYRDKAWEKAKSQAEKLGLCFYSNCTELPFEEDFNLSSEQELREFRHKKLEEIRVNNSYDYIALAHHLEDLLETRLIRLIRGTGPEGLQAMSFLQGSFVRPFLNFSREILKDYLKESKQEWLDDPSNDHLDPLRNWIRKSWLPELEKKREGSVKAMGRSLELICQALAEDDNWMPECFEGENLLRRMLLDLPYQKQSQLIAFYLKKSGAKAYRKSHVEEVIKRLDNPQKRYTFQVAGFIWEIDARHVKLRSQ